MQTIRSDLTVMQFLSKIEAPPISNRTGDRGIPNELNAEYYAQRSTAGLIITEGTYPHPTSRGYTGQPGIYTDEQVAGWRLVTNAH